MKIRTLLELKGKTVVKVRPDDTISKAAHLMKLHHAGCVVVSEDGKHVSGIVSVDDVVKHAVAEMDMEKGVLQERAHLYQTLEDMR